MTGHPDDAARGFPAFPAGRRGRRFARSWWGRAWVDAIEDSALDEEPLRRGRRYAQSGHVGPISVGPGRIAAEVHDGDHESAWRAVVHVRQFTDVQWDRLLTQVAAEAGHVAALLNRAEPDLPPELGAAAEDAGAGLLPGIGDLEPECDCPDWEHPCRHAAALCYQVSWLLDADPFLLLLMRGRGQGQLLGELNRVSTPTIPGDGFGYMCAESSADGYLWRTCDKQREVRALEVAPAPGIDPDELRRLVADAAELARALLAEADPVG